ncbi:hypothetical protein MNBD_GAMMA25-1993 [hydrothermal vent metagenome]|uniref:Uncharacterized protein n=1 Tax=hydrothermal vent metagenome TaxID=652676 RepID=A0A3B1BS97_9ZZZZ
MVTLMCILKYQSVELLSYCSQIELYTSLHLPDFSASDYRSMAEAAMLIGIRTIVIFESPHNIRVLY